MPGVNRIFILVLSLVLFLTTGLWAAEQLLTTLARQGVSMEDIGMQVGIANGSTLISHNTQRKFIPASVTKMITAAAAVDYLGENYEFTTKILSDAPPVDGVIHGSIYLKSGGDPSFFSNSNRPVLEKFPALLEALFRQNI